MIATTEEIQKYVSVDINLQQKSVLPYLDNGKYQIVRLLGKPLYAALELSYNTDKCVSNAEYLALLPHVQRPLANFAIHYGLSALNVSINPTGIGVISTQNIAPASKDRTDSLKKDLLEAAHDSMETLLEFLEDNIADYPLWTSSDAYAYQYDILITSARQFDEIIRIDRSRLKYLDWKPTIHDLQTLEIEPQISASYLNELLTEQKNKTLTTANNLVTAQLQRALAYLTAAEMEKDSVRQNVMKQRGMNFLMSARRYMDTNIASYPTYAASEVYSPEKPPYSPYENNEESHFFVM